MKILITGTAGTWGRAFVNHLKDNKEHEIIGIDNTEKAVVEFRRDYPGIKIYLKDFKDWEFAGAGFDLLIHLAAYKHIDEGEKNPIASIDNNVIKTKILFINAKNNGVKILFVSTDKSVEPSSVYGATKFLGERMAQDLGGVVVRSGNIINSSGSVLEIWEECCKQSRPLPVTDLEMVRYFIDVKDAVAESWERFNKGDKLIILNGCKEVILKDFLLDFLKTKGLESIADYKPGIKIIGLREGEKLKDKLKWDFE